MRNPAIADGVLDIGEAPPEPEQPVETKPVERDDLKTRALRKIQEDEAFEKQAREALEGFGTMVVRSVPGFRLATQEECEAGGWFLTSTQFLPSGELGEPDWYVELSGDDVERPE